MFSNKDTLIAGLVFLIPPAVFNLSMYFLQDIVITLILYIVLGLYVTPLILKMIINKDPYVVLTYKNLLSSDKKGKNFNLITFLLLALTVTFLLIGVWFGLLSRFNHIILPAPLFHTTWLNYIYLALLIVNAMVAISLEHKLYYGVISTFLPDNVIGYVGIVLFQTLHYVTLAFIITTSDAYAILLLVILFAMFLGLYMLKEKETYKSSTFAHQIVAFVNIALLAVFVGLKYHGKYHKGVGVTFNNTQNVINRIMH